jgi:prepilin-type N-terminal cleavage/methylation domain-containing protein
MKSRSGFTLLELLVVMGIMVLLMSISAIGIMGMRRGAEVRGAVMTVRTTMMLARQQAVTKRQNVSVEFYAPGEDNTMVVVQGTARATNSIVYLPRGVQFTSLPPGLPPTITFTPSGGAGVGAPVTIGLKEKDGVGKSPQSKTITVWLLTGVTEET